MPFISYLSALLIKKESCKYFKYEEIVFIDISLTPLLWNVFNNLYGLVNEPIDEDSIFSIESIISILWMLFLSTISLKYVFFFYCLRYFAFSFSPLIETIFGNPP